LRGVAGKRGPIKLLLESVRKKKAPGLKAEELRSTFIERSFSPLPKNFGQKKSANIPVVTRAAKTKMTWAGR
jgi:hypothetical protein